MKSVNLMGGLLAFIITALCVPFTNTTSACEFRPKGTQLTKNALQNLEIAWNAYVANMNQKYLIQPECKPKRFVPDPGALYKGVVILIHGFLQCPNRFDAEAKILAQEGYEVLLPLLPGHGQKGFPSPLGGMPESGPEGVSGRDGYMQLACEMDLILQKAPDILGSLKLIGGHSTGGAIATAAAEQQAMEQEDRFQCPNGNTIKTHFDGLLLYNPIFKPSHFGVTHQAEIINYLYEIGLDPWPNLPFTEKKDPSGCFNLKLAAEKGIGGTCADIPVSVYGAPFDIGYYAYDNRQYLKALSIQAMTSGQLDDVGDKTVDNQAVQEVLKESSCSHLCNQPDAEHDYFTNPSSTEKITRQQRETAAACAASFFGRGEPCAVSSSNLTCLSP